LPIENWAELARDIGGTLTGVWRLRDDD
jgi:hypothetical protein